MDLHLRNKVVLISGGSKGIGKATALAFAEEGALVSICARGEGDLKNTADEIRAKTGNDIFTFRADMTSPEDIKAFVLEAHRRFGRIDILVNSAGQTKPGSFLELTDDDWMSSWAGKYFGCVRLCREVFKIMRDQRAGVIINVHGASAYRPDEGFILKGNVNAAVMNFTVAIANEGSKFGIRAHGIGPGAIRSEVLDGLIKRQQPTTKNSSREETGKKWQSPPLGRMGEKSEVADLILFFSSDRAAYIQGENIVIDGGALGSCR